jgi:translation initiation factor 5B
MKDLRTPIVCVMGHVDHGKTTLLDRIRRTNVTKREAGGITQHIGATEVPISAINSLCAPLMKQSFNVPGLLFIDTPGHRAFTTLRKRGGSLADLAVLIVDVMEGFQPQTYESIGILQRFKTPFVIAANKIDRIHGWKVHEDSLFSFTYERQTKNVKHALDECIYRLIGSLYEEGFNSDRYDRIKDFRKNVGIVPISSKTGEGIPDLLMVLVGLAQKFLESGLYVHTNSEGIGSILEIKGEKGLGTTIDVILYDGEIKRGDRIVMGGRDEPIVTKVKALLEPGPLSELREERSFKRVRSVKAAAGVKIVAPNMENALAGLPVRVVGGDLDGAIEEVKKEREPRINICNTGIIIKSDSLGSLEALANELEEVGVPIQKAGVGDISKHDAIEASTIKDPLLSVILGFNVGILPDVKDDGVIIFRNDVIYRLIEDYDEWRRKKQAEIEQERLEAMTIPCRFQILPDYVFRTSRPAIVGVRILGGRIKSGTPLIREDGERVGVIGGIQRMGEKIECANYKDEVAVAIEGPTIGRQIREKDILYADIQEEQARELVQAPDLLSSDEMETLEMFLRIKRREDLLWNK